MDEKSKNGKRETEKREWKWIFWLFSYSTKHTRNPMLSFLVHSSPTYPPTYYFLHHEKRNTRTAKEQPQIFTAIIRPLKTFLSQFLKVRQALSCVHFYLKNVFRVFPSGVSFSTSTWTFYKSKNDIAHFNCHCHGRLNRKQTDEAWNTQKNDEECLRQGCRCEIWMGDYRNAY